MKTKEFFTRWKQGILEITPYQQARIVYYNTYLLVLGILCGVVVTSWLSFTKLWWLVVILIASLVNVIIQQIGNYQKFKVLGYIERRIHEQTSTV